MREIKFRFWHKRVNKFDDGSHETLGYVHNNKVFEIYNDHGGMFSSGLVKEDVSDDTVIQQYTGLKDKNGREIYEGDICAGESLKNRRFTVEFQDGGFSFVYLDSVVEVLGHNTTTSSFVTAKYVQVVGNIFEGVDNERD
jgi:uncharacterized phage protein (TIGR01671 family)